MLPKVYGVMGTTVAVALVVAGLWGFSAAASLAKHADRPELALWAVRSAAIAAIAAAQVLGLSFVVSALYDKDRVGEIMRLSAGLVCTAGIVSAITLAIISQ